MAMGSIHILGNCERTPLYIYMTIACIQGTTYAYYNFPGKRIHKGKPPQWIFTSKFTNIPVHICHNLS